MKRHSRGTRWHLSSAEKRVMNKMSIKFTYGLGLGSDEDEEMKRRVEKALARSEIRKCNPLRWLTPCLWPTPWSFE